MIPKSLLVILFLFILSSHILAAEPPGEDVGAQAERFGLVFNEKTA